jgi:hypothetical protein
VEIHSFNALALAKEEFDRKDLAEKFIKVCERALR